MGRPEFQRRLLQDGCLLFLVVWILLLHFGALGSLEPSGRELKLTQLLMLVGAIWSAVVGFTFQRKLTRIATRSRRSGTKSTPFTRWKAGHVMRLATATSVGTWGMALYYFHGTLWLVDTVLAVALILLVAWKPGASPNASAPSVHP
jgi:Na+/H+-translocating membrane pyrophosphatase